MKEEEQPNLLGSSQDQGNELGSSQQESGIQDPGTKPVENRRVKRPRASKRLIGLGIRVHDWTALADILIKENKEESSQ